MRHRRPPHIYRDTTWYMVTASTYWWAPLLMAPRARDLVRDEIHALVPEYGLTLRAWVILGHHYHVLLRTGDGALLPKFMNRLHGRTSRQLNLWDEAEGRTVWYSYWDTCLDDERGYWTRFNYIHYNPVKHGFVTSPQDWDHSSYRSYLESHGAAWLAERVARYPVRAAHLDEEERG